MRPRRGGITNQMVLYLAAVVIRSFCPDGVSLFPYAGGARLGPKFSPGRARRRRLGVAARPDRPPAHPSTSSSHRTLLAPPRPPAQADYLQWPQEFTLSPISCTSTCTLGASVSIRFGILLHCKLQFP